MPITSSPVKVADTRLRHETKRISERLRELRLGRKLTISRLAELSKVPASTISKIENGQLRPSLVHAINLASALRENLGFLVARFRERPQPRAIVRHDQRDAIEYPEMGLTLQDLSGHFLPGILEARLGILARGAHSGVGSMSHRGEEFCFVLSGAISFRIDEATYDLGANEYLHFSSSIPHSWENAVADETRVVWIFTDGLSFNVCCEATARDAMMLDFKERRDFVAGLAVRTSAPASRGRKKKIRADVLKSELVLRIAPRGEMRNSTGNGC